MCTNMNNSALGFLLLSLVCIVCVITDVARAQETDKATTEPEAAPGCPIPDLRYSRPRVFETAGSTELPTEPGAATLAAGLSTDGPMGTAAVGGGDDDNDETRLTADRPDDVVRHSRYIDFDPYAREETKTFAYTGNDIAPSHTDLDLDHAIHRRRNVRSGQPARPPKSTLKSSASTTTPNIEVSSSSPIGFSSPSSILKHPPSSFASSSIDTTTTTTTTTTTITTPNHLPMGRRTDTLLLLNALDTTTTTTPDHRSLARAPPNDTTAAAGGRRVKRKSGKTTGALSRPKGASDSGSKSTSRKKDGASLDEEGLYIVHAVDDSDDEEEEEEVEDAVEHDLFGEVTEVHFPAELGTGGERKLCRLRCVQGRWVGPICGSNKEGDEAITAE